MRLDAQTSALRTRLPIGLRKPEAWNFFFRNASVRPTIGNPKQHGAVAAPLSVRTLTVTPKARSSRFFLESTSIKFYRSDPAVTPACDESTRRAP